LDEKGKTRMEWPQARVKGTGRWLGKGKGVGEIVTEPRKER
jgi:hypothetical protein